MKKVASEILYGFLVSFSLTALMSVAIYHKSLANFVTELKTSAETVDTTSTIKSHWSDKVPGHFLRCESRTDHTRP